MHEIRASVFLPTCRRKLPWTFAVHRIETSTRKWHTRADHTWPLAGIRDRNYRWSNWLHKSLNKAMIAQDYFPQLPSGTQMVSFRARLLRARALVSLRNSLSLSLRHEQSIAISPRVFFCNPIFRGGYLCVASIYWKLVVSPVTVHFYAPCTAYVSETYLFP